jgi:hypothetical protein
MSLPQRHVSWEKYFMLIEWQRDTSQNLCIVLKRRRTQLASEICAAKCVTPRERGVEERIYTTV